jgi:hypothetical protein
MSGSRGWLEGGEALKTKSFDLHQLQLIDKEIKQGI